MTTSTDAKPVSLYGFVTPRPGHADRLRSLLLDLVEPSRGHAVAPSVRTGLWRNLRE
ncbi:hypothetical protein ACFO1B_40615 [Dactylosporangium siamense]|uniref:hypothetical protein n=1 Tax=Dactylosporangium siamense TaxID=685454 RepID=UPI0019406F68|nr:hypothetical protein [Dactylosporangium siamense]